MPKKAPRNIKEYIGDLYTEPPDKIISKIRVDLEPFIDQILKSDFQDLYLVGRKSRHLFQALITSRLMEKSSGIHFLNTFTGSVDGSRICILHINQELPKEISLLADSIDEGQEKAEIVNTLSQNGCKVNKIFCYVANQKGIDYLTSKNILSRDQIISVYTMPSDDYHSFNNRLETYYQSRIEPMDIDHKFEIYTTTKKITRTKLKAFFKEAVNHSLKCSSGEFNEAKILNDQDEKENLLFAPDSVVNYNYDCYDFPGCSHLCKRQMSKILKGAEPEYIQIRLKADLKETESRICVMVFCPLSPEKFSLESVNAEECVLDSFCRLKYLAYDESQVKKEEVMSIVCPQCAENHLSSYIISKIMPRLKLLIAYGKVR